MGNPSNYELDAWNKIQHFKPRPLSGTFNKANEKLVDFGSTVASTSSKFVSDHPKLQKVASGITDTAQKGVITMASGGMKILNGIPGLDPNAVKEIGSNLQSTVGKVSRIGLSQKQVLKKHQKRSHDVTSFQEIRKLDLEKLDVVKGRAITYSYPASAALSGMATGFAITGTQALAVTTAGAGAAPGFALVSGAMAADAAAILSLSSRVTGHTALLYGYDPEEPVEKLYQLSVLNLATAGSQTAKTAAWQDISRLTQNLYRNKTWKELDKAVLSRVINSVAKKQGHEITKKTLGKVIPVVSIVTGGVLNWATLERISDIAELTYRRRFLLEKYPHLEVSDSIPDFINEDDGTVEDEAFSVVNLTEEILRSSAKDLPEENV